MILIFFHRVNVGLLTAQRRVIRRRAWATLPARRGSAQRPSGLAAAMGLPSKKATREPYPFTWLFWRWVVLVGGGIGLARV